MLISGTSGYYSIVGLTRLFAGAVFEVAVLGIVLELAKVIITTSLQRYWKSLNFALKAYLMVAITILMLITSAGIYGFLSSAYQNTIIADSISSKLDATVDSKIDRYITVRDDLNKQYAELSKNISAIQSSETVNSDKYFSDAIKNRDKISIKIDRLNDSIEKYDSKKLIGLSNTNKSQELSSLKYISQLTGVAMDRILNYFLLLIIFVFDPLALAMLIVYNFIQIKKQDDQPKVEIPIENEVTHEPMEIQSAKLQDSKNDLERHTPPKNSKVSTNTNNKKKHVESKENVQIRGDNILTPEQLKNMSHQSISKILSGTKT